MDLAPVVGIVCGSSMIVAVAAMEEKLNDQEQEMRRLKEDNGFLHRLLEDSTNTGR